MILFQVLHIFEEIAFGAYKLVQSLNKYLFAASILVIFNFTHYILILSNLKVGFYLGIFSSFVLAFGNGLVHIYGWLKTWTLHGSLDAGVFSSLPLSIVGIIVFIQLVGNL